MNISEALRRGYEFDLTEGRLVFRTPYGQPESFSAQVTVKSKRITLNATKSMFADVGMPTGKWCSSTGGPCNFVFKTRLGDYHSGPAGRLLNAQVSQWQN